MVPTLTQVVKESDTGLQVASRDLPADRQRMSEEHPLQVARCTKIIPLDPELAEAAKVLNPPKGADEQDKYVINIKQAKLWSVLVIELRPPILKKGFELGTCVSFLSNTEVLNVS